MNLEDANYEHLNERLSNLFWLLFRALIYLGLLASVAISIGKYVVYSLKAVF